MLKNLTKYILGVALLAMTISHAMAAEKTLSLIKPDATAAHHIGEIIAIFESNGLTIADLKMGTMSENQAKEFYAEHKGKPFYDELVKYISSGPIVAIVLEGDQAIQKNRKLMGATDPKQAEQNTIRAKFAKSKSQNAVHGSDSKEAAQREIDFFFKEKV